MTATRAEGVAGRLRADTRSGHDRTETSPYLAALIGGRLPLRAYVDMLAQLHAVYEALENAEPGLAGDPLVGPFLDPALHRLAPLEADLRLFEGNAWRVQHPLLPSTAAYAAALLEPAPLTFLANHYTRYLGDLSGGLVIGRRVRETYQLDSEGARFFAFPAVRDTQAYKNTYRARLDAAPVDAAELTAAVTSAYEHNARIFDDLAARHCP